MSNDEMGLTSHWCRSVPSQDIFPQDSKLCHFFLALVDPSQVEDYSEKYVSILSIKVYKLFFATNDVRPWLEDSPVPCANIIACALPRSLSLFTWQKWQVNFMGSQT